MSKTAITSVRAFAPATIGNVGPGFDILGLAITGMGDEVLASHADVPGVHLLDPGHPELPTDPARHTSAIAATEVLRRAGATDVGVALRVTKGLALSGGQGGSAASAVAGAVAVNALLGNPLDQRELLRACLTAELAVAGRHLDNLAPCLLGGCVLIESVETCTVHAIPTPAGLSVVLVHPHQTMRTADGRSVLPAMVSRETALTQAARVAGLVAALMSGDLALLTRSIDDHIAEPVRAPLLRGFVEAKAAALSAGALGCSISGSGPTAFAFAQRETAEAIGKAMHAAYEHAGVGCEVHIGTVDQVGARIV
ncbi:MAG TPA: homoserine kinase [Gemmatimonadaceae bacterium]|nr:homoserine kinase [Gemmatimonadaceae bacterium]